MKLINKIKILIFVLILVVTSTVIVFGEDIDNNEQSMSYKEKLNNILDDATNNYERYKLTRYYGERFTETNKFLQEKLDEAKKLNDIAKCKMKKLLSILLIILLVIGLTCFIQIKKVSSQSEIDTVEWYSTTDRIKILSIALLILFIIYSVTVISSLTTSHLAENILRDIAETIK